MNPFRPNDIHSATLPLYYVSRLLGLASYRRVISTSTSPSESSRSTDNSDTYELERNFQTSKCAVLYTGVLLLVLLAWFIYSVVWSVLYGFSDVKLTYVVTQTVTLCLSDTTAAVSLGLELTYNRMRLKKIMLNLTLVDKILIPDPSYLHKRLSGFVVLEVVVFVLLLLLRHGYEMWSRGWKEYINVLITFMIHFISTIMIIQFVTYVHIMKERFRCVNKQLSLFGGINDGGTSLEIAEMGFSEAKLGISVSHDTAVMPLAVDIPNYSSTEDASAANSAFVSDADVGHLPFVSSPSQSRPRDVGNIHTLRYVQAILYDTCYLINSAYGFQLLLSMAYIFVSVVKYCHMVMISDTCSNQYELSNICVDGIVPLMCVVSIHVACVLFVNVFCNSACFEAAVTTTLVNKFLLKRSLHSDAMGELRRFSQQLLHSKVQFSAFGVFNLDFTFIYGFVGGAATYIVILLQFQ